MLIDANEDRLILFWYEKKPSKNSLFVQNIKLPVISIKIFLN